jgi:hypothetical protein
MSGNKQKLSRLLAGYKPHPGPQFYQKMERAPWNQKELKMNHRSNRPARLGWAALAVVLVLAVLSLGIPSVRASVSAWLGLSVAPSNQAPAAAVTLVAFPSPTPGAALLPTATTANVVPSVTAVTIQAPTPAAPAVNRPAEVAQMSVQAGWDVLAAGGLPQAYKFESAYFETNNQMALLTYLATRPLPGTKDPSLTSSSTITLLEALKNDFVPLQVSPDASVTDIQVNGQPAAYAVGAWDTEFVPDAKDPQGGRMVSTWRNDLKVQNVYWQVGEIYLVLVTDDAGVSKEELIAMAGSVGK